MPAIREKIIEQDKIVFMGLEESVRHGGGDYRYTDAGMCWQTNKLKPKLYLSKLPYLSRKSLAVNFIT